MNEDTQNLEEVVVIGYGTSKAKDLTAPIAVIKADEITKHATSSPMGAFTRKSTGCRLLIMDKSFRLYVSVVSVL